LFGFFAPYPQQVGESNTLTTRNPKEPSQKNQNIKPKQRDRFQTVSLCIFGLAGQGVLRLSSPGVDPIGDNPGH
jgi:hypothetical protein